MFNCGDRVVYGIHGVCQIVATETQTVNRKKVEYYVLEPINQAGSRYFVPSQNQAAVAKLRPLLSKDELTELLRNECSQPAVWIDDENQRKQYYRELITDGNRVSVLQMVRALRNHRDQQTQAGKKFHISDANFLRDAEKILYSEFSMVLDIPYDQVEAYIAQF